MRMFVSFICVIFLLSFNTAHAKLTKSKCYKQWCSGIFVQGGTKMLRMGTVTNIGGENLLFVIDFATDATSCIPSLMIDRGKYRSERPTKNANIRIDTRVDTKPIFSNEGVIDDDADTRYIYIGKFSDSNRFINEAIHGSTIRMKLYFDDPVFVSFSLQGFTAAFKRLMSFAEAPDSLYFN